MEKVLERSLDDVSPDLGSPRFVALSRFTISNGMTAQVKQAFVERPHLVDGAPGFLPMEVISPVDEPDEIWLLTYWSDEESFKDVAQEPHLS